MYTLLFLTVLGLIVMFFLLLIKRVKFKQFLLQHILCKNKLFFIIQIAITITIGVFFLGIIFFRDKMLAVDSQLFYYGRNTYKHDLSLPFGMIPEYRGYDMGKPGFVLLDKYEICGRAYKIKPGMVIDSFLSYGFKDNLLISLVKATDKQKYYVIFRKILNNDIRPYQGAECITEIQSYESVNLSAKYNDLTWIDVTDINAIKLLQEERAGYSFYYFFYFLIITNISILCALFILWFKRKNNLCKTERNNALQKTFSNTIKKE